MEIPDWLVDDVLTPANPTAFRLAVMLLRHGRPVAGNGGGRVHWRGTKQQFARLVGASKPALAAAEAELVERGVLSVHRPENRRDSYSVSLALWDQRQHSCHPPESEDAPIAAADHPIHKGLRGDRITGTTTPAPWTAEEIENLLGELAATGARDANAWLRLYGPERCNRALYQLERAETRSQIRNPAGFVYRLLSNGRDLPEAAPIHDDLEERKRRYLGGFPATVFGRLGQVDSPTPGRQHCDSALPGDGGRTTGPSA